MIKDNTILLVDKDGELCDALEIYLSRLGYEVIKTATGQTALSVFASDSPSRDLSFSRIRNGRLPGELVSVTPFQDGRGIRSLFESLRQA